MKDSFNSLKISLGRILKSLIDLINSMCDIKMRESQILETTNKCFIFGSIDRLIVIKRYSSFFLLPMAQR